MFSFYPDGAKNIPFANSLRFCRRFGKTHQEHEWESTFLWMMASYSVLHLLNPPVDYLTLHLSHHGPSRAPRGYKHRGICRLPTRASHYLPGDTSKSRNTCF